MTSSYPIEVLPGQHQVEDVNLGDVDGEICRQESLHLIGRERQQLRRRYRRQRLRHEPVRRSDQPVEAEGLRQVEDVDAVGGVQLSVKVGRASLQNLELDNWVT